MRFLFLALVWGVTALAVSRDELPSPATTCLTVFSGGVECRSEPHPDTRRIFPCPVREQVLLGAAIDRAELAARFPSSMAEHEQVKAGLVLVAQSRTLTPLQQAVLWEEIAAILQRNVGKPVSQSYRGILGSAEIYVFQGLKRFDGKVYVLAILPDGTARSGRQDPIEHLEDWRGRLDELKPM